MPRYRAGATKLPNKTEQASIGTRNNRRRNHWMARAREQAILRDRSLDRGNMAAAAIHSERLDTYVRLARLNNQQALRKRLGAPSQRIASGGLLLEMNGHEPDGDIFARQPNQSESHELASVDERYSRSEVGSIK